MATAHDLMTADEFTAAPDPTPAPEPPAAPEGAAPAAGSYPLLLVRWWLVNARLQARALARAVRPADTPDDRRLAALLAATAVALLLLLGTVIAGDPAAITVVATGTGFFLTLPLALALLFGPTDDECRARWAEVAAALPGAKRGWDERRAERKAGRAARRAERREARAARREARRAAKAPAARPTGNSELVPLTPARGGPPAAWLAGDGTFAVPVAGEVHLPRILESAGVELPAVGQGRVVRAVLRLDHPDDPGGAVVEVGGRAVGRLAPADAAAVRARAGVGARARCQAAVRGWWDQGRPHYGVWLDVAPPAE